MHRRFIIPTLSCTFLCSSDTKQVKYPVVGACEATNPGEYCATHLLLDEAPLCL